MIDFINRYLCFGEGKQRSSSVRTLEKKKPTQQAFVCDKCRKEIKGKELFQVHKTTYCPGLSGGKNSDTSLLQQSVHVKKSSLKSTVIEYNLEQEEKEKKSPAETAQLDRSQIYKQEENKSLLSLSTTSNFINSPNLSTAKLRNEEPLKSPVKHVQEEEIKPLKGDQDDSGSSSAFLDPLDRFVEELKSKPFKERQLMELKYIGEHYKKNTEMKYLVCEKWIDRYTEFLNGKTPVEPGPIDNEEVRMKFIANRLPKDNPNMNQIIWTFLVRVYGGGPEIPQPPQTISNYSSESDKFSEPVTADTMSRSDGTESLRGSQSLVIKKTNFHLKPVGMSNDSYYCYMNSCLQGLLSIGELAHYVHEEKYDAHVNNKNYKFWKGVNDVVSAHKKRGFDCNPRFLRKISMNMFNPEEQHDAHEYLRFLLSGLQDEINLARPKKEVEFTDPETSWAYYRRYHVSIVDELFAGQLMNRVICSACSHISTTFDPFLDLSLPIIPGKTKNLDDCLEAFQKDEEIKDGFVCEKCKNKVKVAKKLVVSKFPRYLVLHLKRFQTYPKKRKLIDHINFPVENWNIKNQLTKQINTYSLVGNIVHRGSFDSGHYVCYCKRGGEWILCDDESTKSVLQKEVTSREAYVLIYERKNM